MKTTSQTPINYYDNQYFNASKEAARLMEFSKDGIEPVHVVELIESFLQSREGEVNHEHIRPTK